METYILIFSILFLGYWCWKYAKSTKNLPPGPAGMPILGYVPFMSKNPHLQFSKLKAKYGDIFCFYVGQKLCVVLSSYALVKEALIKQGNNFAARPVIVSMVPPEFRETKGIALTTGNLFNEFKQLILPVIKTFTRSGGIGESIVTNEIQYMQSEIDQHQGEPIDICELISTSLINVTWYYLFSERTNKNDDKFKTMLHNTHERTHAAKSTGIEYAFPHIFKIPFVRKIFKASIAVDSYRHIHNYFNDKITEMETSAKLENEFNFVLEWFKVFPKHSANYDFYRKQLPPVIIDLFTGGIETSAAFLQWAILYMMEYPDIQKKVQLEINEIIGKFNKPSMMDKSKMPFTDATLMEVHRITSLAPLSIPHLNTNTSTISGYTIPENSIIIPNLWEIHHNPETFPNPDAFQPERFLENGELKKVDELIPFSIGKRQCTGEALARMELFLIFTSLLQRYTFEKPGGVQSDFSYNFGFILSPRPFKVIAIPN